MSKTLYEELREERIQQQERGVLPEWVTTNGYQLFKEKYLWDCNNFKEQAKRIARVAAEHTNDTKGWRKKFFDIIWSGDLALATPVLANMGTSRGCPVSCSGGYVEDSIFGFYESRKEVALLSKHGFGTSSYLGDIRSRGSAITGGGQSSGVLPEFKGMVQVSRDVSQGGVRRGAWAGYLELDHPDFWEVITYLLNNPDDANIGWIVTEKFINRLQSGDPEALAIYQKALKVKCTIGKGYFWFVDKVNAQRPECYKHYNRYNKASNLCVSYYTKILTKLGYRIIGELEGQKVEVWNGQEFSEVRVEKTGVNQQLLEITTSSGKILRCTPYHKFYDHNGTEFRAKDLYKGMNLMPWALPGSNSLVFESIGSVKEVPGLHDTYCFNEPIRHMGVFNGILTGNCTEISLSSDEEHTYTCILSSLNLSNWDRIKDSDTIFNATVFLDCVASEFIKVAKNIRGLEKAIRYTQKSRALGLGTLGFHTYLQQNNIAIEEFEAHMVNNQIFKQIHDQSLEASQWMAKEFGEPEWCKGFGLRNTHRGAIAPNMSSSLICGGVSQGIEPVFQNVYTQGSAGGEMNRINPVLLKVMKDRGVYNDDTIKNIGFKKGSVQHVDWLDKHEKLVFKTAFEIDQRALLRLASTRQKYICQAQSLNLFFAADEDEAYISEIHKEAFLDPNIKSLYYLRSESGIEASKGECEACSG